MYVPDNYDAYEAHEAKQEDWLESRPKCVVCGEHIQGDYLFEIGDALYCEKCMEKEFRKDTEDYER